MLQKENIMKTEIIGTRISPAVRATLAKLALSKGISLSEYVRQLIIADLDKRSVFTSQLKKNRELSVTKKDYSELI